MMVHDAVNRAASRLAGERGTTLIETTIATAMLLVATPFHARATKSIQSEVAFAKRT